MERVSTRVSRLALRLALVALVLGPAQSLAQGGGLVGGVGRGSGEPGNEVRPGKRDIRAAIGGLTGFFATEEEPVARALSLAFVPTVERATVGQPLTAWVTLRNTSLRAVYDVGVKIDTASNPSANRGKLRLLSAEHAPVGSRETPRTCVVSEAGSVTCEIDEIAVEPSPDPDFPQGVSIRLQFEVGRDAQPGSLTLRARATGSGSAAAGPLEQQIVLVSDPRGGIDVDLHVRVESEGGPVTPGERFSHQVVVRNTSPTDSANRVEVLVRNRLLELGDARWLPAGSPVQGGVLRLADDSIYKSAGTVCVSSDPGRHLCTIEQLRPGEEVRIPFEWVMSVDLAPARVARFETWAQARSREHDIDPGNSRARAFTGIVSRAPELVFLVPVRIGQGSSARTLSRPADSIAPGQRFEVAARFMSPLVMPTGPLAVEIFAEPDGSARGDRPLGELTLEGGEVLGFDRSPTGLVSIYRSAVQRIVAGGGPGALAGPEVGRVRVVYSLPENELLEPRQIERVIRLGR